MGQGGIDLTTGRRVAAAFATLTPLQHDYNNNNNNSTIQQGNRILIRALEQVFKEVNVPADFQSLRFDR